jgi:uncharacterized LabA/DUF88 family protein
MDKKRVAMVIDGPNHRRACLDLGLNMNFPRLLDFLEKDKDYVFSVLKLYYDQVPGNQSVNSFYRAMREIGFDLVAVPMHEYGYACRAEGKNFKSSTDQLITIQVMRHLINDEFDEIIFFTGDSDYRFLLEEIKKVGKKIIIYSTSTTVSRSLILLADEVVRIDQIDKDSDLLLPVRRYTRPRDEHLHDALSH